MLDRNSTTIIETRNVKRVRKEIAGTVRNNGFLAITAEVGSGKTTLYNHFSEFWSSDEQRFALVTLKAFRSQQSRIGSIMKMMIQTIDPDAKMPREIERQYNLLEDTLRRAHTQGKIPILLIDEAQDISHQTFRDLKKIHEIDGAGKDHLFAIILFGKPEWEKIFKTRELGYRVRRVRMDFLTAEEIILIAQQRFGLRFKDTKTQEKFAQAINYKTPLGVQHLSDVLETMEEFDTEKRIVTQDLINQLPFMSVRLRMKQAGVTREDVVSVAQEMFPQSRISSQRVSEYTNGKMGDRPDTAEKMRLVVEEAISRKTGTSQPVKAKEVV